MAPHPSMTIVAATILSTFSINFAPQMGYALPESAHRHSIGSATNM
jgi:hypothetical protein